MFWQDPDVPAADAAQCDQVVGCKYTSKLIPNNIVEMSLTVITCKCTWIAAHKDPNYDSYRHQKFFSQLRFGSVYIIVVFVIGNADDDVDWIWQKLRLIFSPSTTESD